ncbi:MAG: hypothetical protein WAW96_21560 [Alphaproteobacteria bacterium]
MKKRASPPRYAAIKKITRARRCEPPFLERAIDRRGKDCRPYRAQLVRRENVSPDPDIKVGPTFADYTLGRDPPLDAALARPIGKV